MKKNVLVLAISTVLAIPAAMADVTIGPVAIYGTLSSAVEIISVDNVNTSIAKTAESQTRLADQTSKLGLKAKYDLGADGYALAQIESRLYLGNNGDSTDNKAEIGSRNTFIGLGSDSLGVVRLGRYDNAYKLSLKGISPTLYGTVNDASSETGSKQILNRLGSRQGDMVAYESPSWAGISAITSYNMGKDANVNATDLTPQAAFGLGYKGKDFNVGLGYTTISHASWNLAKSSGAKAVNHSGEQKLTAVQFGGEYKMGDFTLGAVTERTASSQSGTASAAFDQYQNSYAMSGGYKKGPWGLQARLAKVNDVQGSAVADTGARQFALATTYQIHKYVTAIGSFTRISNDRNANFTSASGFALDKGNSMNQLALGLTASF